jgi:hypothetical protein
VSLTSVLGGPEPTPPCRVRKCDDADELTNAPCLSGASYRKHLKTHEPDRQLKCDQCDYRTAEKREMKIHKTRWHKEEKYDEECPFCSQRIGYKKSNLDRHVKNKHLGEYDTWKKEEKKRKKG